MAAAKGWWPVVDGVRDDSEALQVGVPYEEALEAIRAELGLQLNQGLQLVSVAACGRGEGSVGRRVGGKGRG